MDITKLTPEERTALKAQLEAQEQAQAKAKVTAIETYKTLVSEAVEENFPHLTALAQALSEAKTKVRESFATVLDMKSELYGVKDGQQSHQFMSADGTKRIRIGYNVLDNYDDTAEAGVAMVKEYLNTLAATSPEAEQAVNLALELLARDQKGTLKASRILTLRKQALASGNTQFIEGVDIIMNAYRPIESKSFIKAEYRGDTTGAWISVPGGLTEA